MLVDNRRDRNAALIAGDWSRFKSCSVAWCLAALMLLIQLSGCHLNPRNEAQENEKMAKRDINAVLKDHDKALMTVPGVVGVYVGLLEDGKTPCLKVMVVRKTSELVRTIPKTLEGYPVVVEETGVIRPLPNK